MKHLIVGRTSALGADLTDVLRERGDTVIGAVRRPVDTLDVRCDVRSDADVASSVEEATRLFGEIDSLIYLPGTAPDGRTEKVSDDQFSDALDVNTTGAFRFAKSVLARDTPCCVTFVGTTNALRGSAGQAAYASSKAALLGLTRSLAAEFGPRGKRVNLVAPGYFSAGLTDALPTSLKERLERGIPIRRFAETREVSNVVAFAASEQSSYMNGSVIYVDGGLGMGH